MATPNHEAKDLDGLIDSLKEAYDEIAAFIKANNAWPFKFDSRVIIDAANRLDAMHDMMPKPRPLPPDKLTASPPEVV